MDKEFWKSNVRVGSNIRSHILSEDEMRDIGFTHYDEDAWYYYCMVGDGISLNVIIADDESFAGIKVLSEEQLQPFSLQNSLDVLGYKASEILNNKIENKLRYFQNVGVLEGVY